MRIAALFVFVLAVAAAPMSCHAPPVVAPIEGSGDAGEPIVTDGDITITTSDPCTLIIAQTTDETSTTCASRDEADAMTAFIALARDGGGPPSAACELFPPTPRPLRVVCATHEEVLRAIDFLSEQRRGFMQQRLPRKHR